MKNIATLFIAFFVSVNIAWAQGTMDDLNNIRKLTQEKKYPEALAAHQQFFEASRGTSGMGGVRLSFALSDWAYLGSVYPPALYALNNLSAGHQKKILEGKSDFGVFQEYAAINEYINKNEETVETFLEIEKKYPETAKSYYPMVKEQLVAQAQIEAVARNANDPIYEYENLRNQREFSLSQLRSGSSYYDLKSINAEFEKRVNDLVEITLKIGMKDEAEEVKRRAATYIKGNLLRKYH